MEAPYTVISLKQGTREWLEWRHQGIGASDAPIIMGESTWMWPDALRIKKRLPVRDEGPTQAMATGIALEPEAQRHYCDKAGIIVEPVCVQSLERLAPGQSGRHDGRRPTGG